ncbi:hypothetical protein RIF29_00362 [Crotalaria pallida]|uniref:Uncharacterized protein n=1 Tax=Crotalaria pallida TaxID=3830 RepID=A0AAN9P6Z9_CROPI
MDLQSLEDADLDNLSPKQAEKILECIEALREKLKGKSPVEVPIELEDDHVADTPQKSEPKKEQVIQAIQTKKALEADTIPEANIDSDNKEADAVLEAATIPENSVINLGKSDQDMDEEGNWVQEASVTKETTQHSKQTLLFQYRSEGG